MEFGRLLVFGVFVNLHLLQLSLRVPQLLRQGLGVLRLLFQTLLNTHCIHTGSGQWHKTNEILYVSLLPLLQYSIGVEVTNSFQKNLTGDWIILLSITFKADILLTFTASEAR